MAKIDHSIYFQQQGIDPFGSIAKGVEQGMRMSDMARQRQVQDQQLQRQAKEDAYLDQKRKQEQADYEAGLVKNHLYGVKDQASYEVARKELANRGFSGMNQLPEVYDPGYVNNILGATLSYQDKRAAEIAAQQAKRQGEIDKRDAEAHNLAMRKGGAEIGKIRAETEKARVAASPDLRLTEAEKNVDKKFAENYNNFTSKGRVNAMASIKKLEEIAKELEQDQGLFESGGGRVEVLPDFMRSRTAIRRRDNAKNAANNTLKELFGGALSDAERLAASEEYYNDKLSNEENAKILRGKIQQLKDGLATETAKAKYYEQNRTLKGFKFNDAAEQMAEKDPLESMSDEQIAQMYQEILRSKNANAR